MTLELPKGIVETECLICRVKTIYACLTEAGTPKPAPKTCGRLACMVETGEMKPVSG